MNDVRGRLFVLLSGSELAPVALVQAAAPAPRGNQDILEA